MLQELIKKIQVKISLCYKLHPFIVIILVALLSQPSHAQSLQSVEITGENTGELMLLEQNVTLTEWHSDKLSGKARTVIHFAGRSSARQMQDQFIETLKAQRFDAKYYQTTSIVDLSDTLWGTSNLVEAKLEKNKRSFPWSSIVLDRDGLFRSAHDLPKKSSAIYILDANGQVMFARQGMLSPEEIANALALLQSEINRLKAQKKS